MMRKFQDLLFKMKGTPLAVCPGCLSNGYAPIGTPTSPKRTRKGQAKMNRLATSLPFFFNDRISALWLGDNVCYVEYTSTDGTVDEFLYNTNTNILTTTSESKAYNQRELIPIFLAALHPSNPHFEYTREATKALLSAIPAIGPTTIVSPTLLGYLCDCFYYDLKSTGNETYDVDVNPNLCNIAKGGIIAGECTVLKDFAPLLGSNNFIKIDYTPHTTKSSTTKSETNFFKEAKAGKHILNFAWNKDQQSHIRPVKTLDNFIPNVSYKKMAMATKAKLSRCLERLQNGLTDPIEVIGNDYVNIIVGGRPGTGKTTTADALSATLGLPIYTAKVTRNTEEDSFEGMTKVDENGKFVLHDTPFSKAFREGGIIVLEEFNLADPGVIQGAIGQAIEYPFILNVDGYQEVHRHPLCVIIATMNTGTQGAREPNQALTSRFPTTLTMDDPDENEFIKILCKHGHPKDDCKQVYKAYTSILNYLNEVANNEDIALCVTMRHCLGALQLISDGIVSSKKEAIKDTMIGAIALRDIDLAKTTYDVAVDILPID